MKRYHGITLIEIVVAVAIVSMLLSLAIPNMQVWVRNLRIRTAAESILSGMQQAQIEAIKTNTATTFWLVSDLTNSCSISNIGRYWVVSTASPQNSCAGSLIQKSSITNNEKPDTNVSASSSGNNNASCITFNSFGGVDNSCINSAEPIARVVNSGISGTRTLEVRITTGGSIRLCDPDSNLSSSDPRKC